MNRPQRLLEVLYSFDSGGSERLGVALAQGLAARGWDVTVAATHSANGPVRDALEAAGIACHGLDIESRGRLARRWAIFRLCRRLQPDVLHAQHIHMLMLAYWPARLAGVRRFVVSEHSDRRLRERPGLRRRLRRYARRVSQITVIHDELARYLVEDVGIAAERVQVIVNGVDAERFAPAPRNEVLRYALGAEPGDVLVGCVARLDPVKDHDTLLRAFALLRESQLDARVRLVLVGEGEERCRIEALARSLGIDSRITLLGDRADIDRLMPQFDILALASRTEGLPMVLLEAMACGIPCVATSVGGIPGLFAGGAGELVSPGDTQELAEKLAALCADAGYREGLGRHARASVLAGHRQTDMVAAYEAVLSGSDMREPLASHM